MNKKIVSIIGLLFITIENLLANSAIAWKQYQTGRAPFKEILIVIGVIIIFVVILKLISFWKK